MRLSCRKFASFMRTLELPRQVEHGSLTTLREKLVKIGAKVVRHGRYDTFQMAEIAVPRDLVPYGQESGCWFPDPACCPIIAPGSRSHLGNIGSGEWGQR